MRVTTNPKLIRRRGRLGMIASLTGIIVLAAGMFASLRQQYMWMSLVALILGFALAQVGSYNLRRWSRSPRPDQVLEAGLKGFDDRYHLYSWTLPAPFVLLGPQGIYSVNTKDHTGKISVTGSRWSTKATLARLLLLFGQEGLGNPSAEAQAQAAKLSDWIKAKLPNVSAAVQPLVVFIDERADLQINEPTVPVLDAKAMKKWLRGGGKGDALKPADLKALEALFDEAAAKAAQ